MCIGIVWNFNSFEKEGQTQLNGHHEGSCWLAFNFDWFPDTYYISYLDIFSIMFFLLLSSAMMSMFKLLWCENNGIAEASPS